MSTRSSLTSLQEVLDDAASKGTQDSELCQRLAHRLRQAHAWSARATRLLSTSQAAAQLDAHPQQAPPLPLQAAAAAPAAPMGAASGDAAGPAMSTVAGGTQHATAASVASAGTTEPAVEAAAATAAASEGPAIDRASQFPAQPGMQPLQDHAAGALLQDPQAQLQSRAAAPPSEATDGAPSARPTLAELESLVTEGNLLGVKLDALNDANAALSSVRAWLKQVSVLYTSLQWLLRDEGMKPCMTSAKLPESCRRSYLMSIQIVLHYPPGLLMKDILQLPDSIPHDTDMEQLVHNEDPGQRSHATGHG